MEKQIRKINWNITVPMEFPKDWTDEDILLKLNESSWCCSNLIDLLIKMDKKFGCICSFCEASLLEEDDGK